MSEMIPSESGDYGDINPELYAADFTEWEQELESEPSIAELSHKLGSMSLSEAIEYDEIVEPPEEPEEPEELKKPNEQKEKYDYLQASPNNSSRESSPKITQDELFSAAMGLIYFATGIPAEEVFEE